MPLPGAEATSNFLKNLTPAGRAGLYGAGLGTAGYFAAPWVAGKIMEMTGMGSAEDIDQSRVKNIAAILGVLGGAFLATQKDAASPFKYGGNNFVQSLIDKDFWVKHPEYQAMRQQDWAKKLEDVKYKSRKDPERTQQTLSDLGLDKLSSDDNIFFNEPVVPVKSSLDVIDNDKYLNDFQKIKTQALIEGADTIKDSHKGMVSGQNLLDSAVQFGIDYGSAYLFGAGVGSILGLPKPALKKLSVTGGLATAIVNTGIFNED